jgi:phenylpropionate dioxygenase-like ring-hydroxylating dioxygenase large terminal subunit
MFVRNSWYVAAWPEDIGHREPFPRTIIGEPLVFFRTREGKVSAFDDRCPHRRMPLSLGRITEDDKLICAYHGLTFDKEGTCVHVPGQPSTHGICVRSYPVVERWGFVWIWMGEPERADPAEIFDCSWLERAGWNRTSLYRHLKANYLLLNDNLSDLLHLAYLHLPSGIGNEHMGPAKTDLKVQDTGYHYVRETLDIPSPTVYGRLSNVKGNVDRWHVVDYKGPSFYIINTGIAQAGTGGPESALPEGQGRWSLGAHHLITPETEKTTHYFKVNAHKWTLSSDSWRQINQVMEEDVWAIESQQRNIDLRPEAPTTPIPSDAPVFAMRKIVKAMVEAEAQPIDTRPKSSARAPTVSV